MKVAVVGSGAWGTALAIRLCKNGHDVTMWTFETELIPQMEQQRVNPRLPGAVLPENLKISGDYGCVAGCKLVVIASPSFPMRAVCRGTAPHLDADAVLVSVTKGIEEGTCLTGEVGLSGEIRAVNRIEQRILEAEKLGFKRIIIPHNNISGFDTSKLKIEIKQVRKVEEAFRLLFG